MIISRPPEELDIPEIEPFATGEQVEVTGQTELRKDVPILDEDGEPTGEIQNVHDGWKFFPNVVDEYKGGYAIEEDDEDSAMVWLEINPVDFAAFEVEGQNQNDTRMFVENLEEEEDTEIPGQLISKYVQWVRKNISPGKERGQLISAYAQGVTKGGIRNAWRKYYKDRRGD